MADLLVIEPEPCDPSVIEVLEELLARARAGEISSVGLAWTLRDGRCGSTFSSSSPVGLLGGAISRLAWRFHSQWDDELSGR